jgi:hypothetical protein
MVWAREKPTEERETKAGIIEVRAAESPFFKPSNRESWERRKTTYHIFPKQQGSDGEEIGYVTARHKRLGDLKDSPLHDIFTSCGLNDEDRIVCIEDFRLGKKGDNKTKLRDELRNNIGREALEIVLKECKAEGVAAAYCTTCTIGEPDIHGIAIEEPGMEALIKDVGFNRIGRLFTKML